MKKLLQVIAVLIYFSACHKAEQNSSITEPSSASLQPEAYASPKNIFTYFRNDTLLSNDTSVKFVWSENYVQLTIIESANRKLLLNFGKGVACGVNYRFDDTSRVKCYYVIGNDSLLQKGDYINHCITRRPFLIYDITMKQIDTLSPLGVYHFKAKFE
jgi:hypothetical protein